MAKSHCKSFTLEVEFDVIHQMDAHDCTNDVSGLSLILIYKYDAVQEEEDVLLTLTASERGLFVFKMFGNCCVFIYP